MPLNSIIFGNIIMFIACTIMTVAGLPKKKNTCLILQNTSLFLEGIGNLFFKSYPGCIISILSVLRNTLSQKEKLNLPIKIILSILVSVISLYFNNVGLLVILPLTAFISYVFFMNTKNTVIFKLIVIFASTLWLIYYLSLSIYVNSVFEATTVISNCIGIYRIKQYNSDNKKEGKLIYEFYNR